MLNTEIRNALTAAGWIWPAYIQNQHVYRLEQRLLAATTVMEKQEILESSLRSLYPPEDLAAMLLERYRKVPVVKEFQASISEALEAAHLGLFHAAVSTLFPVIEGIIRECASSGGRSVGQGTQKLPGEIDEMIKFETTKGDSAAGERIGFSRSLNSFSQLLCSFKPADSQVIEI